jgi:hypothetical protein
MYRPNFCAECGATVVRLKWHVWTSRRFCDTCAQRLRKERIRLPLIAALGLLCVGFAAGRIGRQSTPPLIIDRNRNSPLSDTANSHTTNNASPTTSQPLDANRTANSNTLIEEAVYICGARTKKGTPCSRRVHGPVRCWQHKGNKAMLPEDKLQVKD